jgi:ribonuclease HII
MTNFNEERKLWKRGYKLVASLDEAGRGPLAGPVVASAVAVAAAKPKIECKKLENLFTKLKDSKKLTPKRREEIYIILVKYPKVKWGIGKVSEKIIDKINILEATKLAMQEAIENLEKKLKKNINFLIIDGNSKIKTKIPQKTIIKADEKVFSCTLASIIAKVTRDRVMVRLHNKYPKYGFDRHKGYATKHHLKMLKKYGPCKIHRKSFRPISNLSPQFKNHKRHQNY